jgi:two-component system nitrogen regulation response regulator GlnG
MSYLLLIDHEPAELVTQLRQAFPGDSHRIEVARTGAAGIAQIRAALPDVVLINLMLPGQCGLDVYQQVRSIDVRIPVIVLTGSKKAEAAIEAMKQGAYDCLFKPADAKLLERVLGDALEMARRHRQRDLAPDADPELEAAGQLLGTSPAMRLVYKSIALVAGQDFPVLITGESGTGKELVARAIHQHSKRAGRTFLALNSAAIPETLLESELFGHEKGAFTGANGKRIGKFVHCDGGTLFLDEIGDMPLASQAKILRVLQEQAFESIGGNETIRTDVRLIAATHRDLTARSAEGKFRPDLYYRLSVFPIHLPPLRDRRNDLPQLVRHYLRRFRRELGREVQEIAPEALERLQSYSWPGNIRELQSVLKQALLQAHGTTLLLADLPPVVGERAGSCSAGENPSLESFVRQCLACDDGDQYAQAHGQLDRLFLARVLETTSGRQHEAARKLGIARQTLRRRLQELGLHVTRRFETAAESFS